MDYRRINSECYHSSNFRRKIISPTALYSFKYLFITWKKYIQFSRKRMCILLKLCSPIRILILCNQLHSIFVLWRQLPTVLLEIVNVKHNYSRNHIYVHTSFITHAFAWMTNVFFIYLQLIKTNQIFVFILQFKISEKRTQMIVLTSFFRLEGAIQ
jgi:hypothetical protein